MNTLRDWGSESDEDWSHSFSIIPLMYQYISSKELLHSEIIAELLQPKGKHGCGDIFLREFMRAIDVDHRQDFSEIKIISESPTTTTRHIDILIVWGDNAVIVENKLNNAVDQPKQLKDYLEDSENKGKKVLKVVYIPIFAWRKTHECLSADIVYLYPQKLSDWLWACARKSKAAHDIALPYIQLLNYMNQSNRNYMKAEELYNILKQSPKLMDEAISLAALINNGAWSDFLRNRILETVKKRIGDNSFHNKILGRTEELWLWYDNYEYKVSIDVVLYENKYCLFLYFDNETAKPDNGLTITANGKSGGEHWYQLSEHYRIGDDADYEKLIAKVVELLEKSRK